MRAHAVMGRPRKDTGSVSRITFSPAEMRTVAFQMKRENQRGRVILSASQRRSMSLSVWGER